MTKEVLNTSIDGIVCIGLHVCKDEGFHVRVLIERRHIDEVQEGDTSIWYNNLSFLHIRWQL